MKKLVIIDEEEGVITSTREDLLNTFDELDAGLTTFVCWNTTQLVLCNRMEHGCEWLIYSYYGWNMSNTTTDDLDEILDIIKEMAHPNIEVYDSKEMIKAQERVMELNKEYLKRK